MLVPAKSSRTSTEPQPIDIGLELIFAEDTTVHSELHSLGFCLETLLFCWVGLFLWFLIHFPTATDNKLLIRKKS